VILPHAFIHRKPSGKRKLRRTRIKGAGNIKFKIKLKIKIMSSQALLRVKWQAVTDVSMNHNALNFRATQANRGEKFFEACLTLKMKALPSFETSVTSPGDTA